MDLTSLRSAAFAEYFNQPIVDTFDIGLCPALPCVHKVDFRTVSETQLASIDIPLHFQISTCSTVGAYRRHTRLVVVLLGDLKKSSAENCRERIDVSTLYITLLVDITLMLTHYIYV